MPGIVQRAFARIRQILAAPQATGPISAQQGAQPPPLMTPQIPAGAGDPDLSRAMFAIGGASSPVPGLEAGSTHRRLASWRPSGEHVNKLIREAGPTSVARARWLARNNGYAKAAVRSWRGAMVGKGIKPSSEAPELRDEINLAWADWTLEADAEGLTDLAGIQRRIAGEAFLVGECFVRLRPRLPQDGLSVPLQLQIMPTEQLPLVSAEAAPGTGNPVRLGIEFDRNLRDKRVAYWFWRENPMNLPVSRDFGMAQAQNLLTRVPAEAVLHIFDAQESGQLRGVTGFDAALVKIFHLDLYDDAELERKKQIARFAAFLKSRADASVSDIDVEREDLPQIGPYGPGLYTQLEPGEEIDFAPAGEVGTTYEPFQYRTLLAIAAALGIPYYELSADLQRASYASSRAGLIAFRNEVSAFQSAVLAYQFLRPVWNAWFDAAVLAGRLPITAAAYRGDPQAWRRAKVIPPKLAWVDPEKDAKAAKLMVDNGFQSRSDVIESTGDHPQETDRRIKADQDRAAALGIGPFPPAAAAPTPPRSDAAPSTPPDDGGDQQEEAAA
jgi:lambda family phage portal protein